MKKASITEAKNNLSALIDGVKGGSPVLILDRGKPVARLEPLLTGATPEDRLARLVRDGIARPRLAAPARMLFSSEPPRALTSAVAALIEERREGR